jgi:hypothetical protein
MNEAPKTIWVEHEEGCWPTVMSDEHQGTGTKYIRSDLINELVNALKLSAFHMHKITTSRGKADYSVVRAALKALEEE